MVYGSITSMAQSFVSSWKNFAIWCCSRPCKPSPCKYWKSSGFSFSGKTDTKVAFREELISAFSFSFVGSSLRTILAKRSKWSFISFHLWDNEKSPFVPFWWGFYLGSVDTLFNCCDKYFTNSHFNFGSIAGQIVANFANFANLSEINLHIRGPTKPPLYKNWWW